MSELSLFLKENKIVVQNRFIQATKSLLDSEGKPLNWEIRPITTKEDESIRESCVEWDAKIGRFHLNVPEYIAKATAAAVVEPNLYNVNLQHSYNVDTPEDLIREIIDNPQEYQSFIKAVRDIGTNP